MSYVTIIFCIKGGSITSYRHLHRPTIINHVDRPYRKVCIQQFYGVDLGLFVTGPSMPNEWHTFRSRTITGKRRYTICPSFV